MARDDAGGGSVGGDDAENNENINGHCWLSTCCLPDIVLHAVCKLTHLMHL